MATDQEQFKECATAGQTSGTTAASGGRHRHGIRQDAAGRSPGGDSAPSPKSRNPPALRIRMFGAFEVYRGDRLLGRDDWSRPDARRLLALLLLHPNGISRGEAGEALWPEGEPTSTSRKLSVALTGLRQAIEPGAATPDAGTERSPTRLPTRQSVLRLIRLPGDDVDIEQFGRPRSLDGLDLTELQALVDLYRGDLLPEFLYEEWTSVTRQSLRTRWESLTLLLAQELHEAGQSDAALAALQSLLAAEPVHEEAVRSSMRLLAEGGRRDEALRVYSRLRQALWTDLAVEPDAATQRLVQSLRSEQSRSIRQERFDALREVDTQIHRLTVERPTAEGTGELCRLWAVKAQLHNQLNECEEALISIARGKELLRGDCPAEEAPLLWTEALTRDLQGKQEDALTLAERAGDLARQAGDSELEARALITSAHVLEQMGLPLKSIEAAEVALRVAVSLGSPELALHASRVAAISTWRAGRMAESEGRHRRNLSDARMLGKLDWEGYIGCGLASSLVAQGKLGEAEAVLAEARDMAARTGDEHLELYVEYQLGTLWREKAYLATEGPRPSHAGSQDIAAARDRAALHLARCLRLADAEGIEYMALFAALDLATTHLDWGDPASALGYMEVVRGKLPPLANNGTIGGWVELGESGLALALGELEAAARHAAGAIVGLKTASPGGLAEAHRAMALACAARGDLAAADRHLLASRNAAIRCGQKLELLRTRSALRRIAGSSAIPVRRSVGASAGVSPAH